MSRLNYDAGGEAHATMILCSQGVNRYSALGKICNSNSARNRKTLAVKFNTFNLVQHLCGEITFSAVRAAAVHRL